MTRTRKPSITRTHTASTAATYLASDGQSGALISVERTATGELLIEVWRADSDVLVRVDRDNLDPAIGDAIIDDALRA